MIVGDNYEITKDKRVLKFLLLLFDNINITHGNICGIYILKRIIAQKQTNPNIPKIRIFVNIKHTYP